MLFNSAGFLIFFPIVALLYFIFPQKSRWMLLLAASCFFYMNFIPVYILLLFYMIFVDFFAGIGIEKCAPQPRLKRTILVLSLLSNLGLLFFFKYFYFFNSNVTALAGFLHWNYPIPSLKFILPLGLSFHTFQSLNYIIEVYRGNQKAERHLGIFALYIMFFPQLAAGPIERAAHMLPQLRETHVFDYSRAADGLKLMAWGFFQKLVIADRVSLYVNQVYAQPSAHTGLQLVLATVFFAFQIYCDFCGYTDIAIGSAQVMGFRLMQNFRQPYFAHSIVDFWKRWHISLSTWFRDYLYLPMGGSRKGKVRHLFNLFITFLVSGLWHGANWTFLIWGAYHGLLMIFFRLTEGVRARASDFFGSGSRKASEFLVGLSAIFTFSLVCLGWIFFRANTVRDAVYILTHLAGREADWSLNSIGKGVEFYFYDYYVAFAAIGILLLVHFLQNKGIKIRHALGLRPFFFRWAFYYGLIFCIWFWGATDVKQFIYFQF